MDDPITARPVEVQPEPAPVVEEKQPYVPSDEWESFKHPPIPYN